MAKLHKYLLVGTGLTVLALALALTTPARVVAQIDVQSLPGDQTGAKQPFQAMLGPMKLQPGETTQFFALNLPDVMTLTIETITVNVTLPVKQIPFVTLSTAAGGQEVIHRLAVKPVGTFVQSGARTTLFMETYAVRLHAQSNIPVEVTFSRLGPTTGFGNAVVTIAGYTGQPVGH
ncbi:MAG: hypothetical protein HY268_32610 [Deltaproteobacteria bacterium]|nr:hypothetical protein [Deltaproteobacteria bacterium]